MAGTGSGNWSNQAYGHAIDINLVENLMSVATGRAIGRAPGTSIVPSPRRGMVTPAVVRAFARSSGVGAASA